MAVDRDKVVQAALKFAEKKRYDKAIAEYQKILQEDPNDPRILLRVAEMQIKGEMYPAALETFDKVGRHYTQQGFAQKAIAVYGQLRELLSRHAPQLEDRYGHVTLEMAKLYQQLGHVADAIAIWEQIATRHQRANRDLDAIEAFKKLTDLDASNPLHRLRMAELLARSRNSEGAIAQFRQAAELLIRMGQTDNALKVYERLLQIRPDPVVARLAATLYLDRGQGNDAMQALAKLQIAFQANQKDLDTLALLARSFEQLNQPAKAVEVYKESVRQAREQNNKTARRHALNRVLEIAPHDENVRAFVRANPHSSMPAPLPPNAEPEAEVVIGGQEEVFLDDEEEAVENLDDAGDIELADEPLPPPRQPVLPPRAPIAPPRPPAPVGKAPPAAPAAPPPRPEPARPFAAPRTPAELRLQLDEPPSARGSVQVPSSVPIAEDFGESISSDLDIDPQVFTQETLAEVTSFRRARQLGRAIECLRIALEVLPDSVQLHEQLRDVLLEVGDREGAIGEMITLATVASAQGDSELALSAINEVLLLSPNHARALELRDSLGFGGLEPLDDGSAPSEDGLLFDDEAARVPDELQFDDEPLRASARPAPAIELDDDPFGATPFDRNPAGRGNPAARPASLRPARPPSVRPARPPSVRPPSARPAPPPSAPPMSLDLDEPDLDTVVGASVGGEHELTFDDEASVVTPQPGERSGVMPSASFDQDELPTGERSEVSTELELEGARPALALTKGFQGGDTVEEALEEVDFFASRGLVEDALAILHEQLQRAPNHPILLERLRELSEEPPAAPAFASPGLSLRPPAETINDELLDASLEALDSFEPTQEAQGHFQGEEQVDVESVFAKFKEGVKAQVDDSDSATHYDLGVAYKEMNLLQDAIGEFQMAARDPQRECVCHSMVGLIEIERGNLDAAIVAFQRAQKATEKTADQEVSLDYELGDLFEKKGDKPRALEHFKKAQRRDPDYRDVGDRVRALEPKKGPGGRQLESEEDLDLVFDDILGGKGF